MKKIKFFLDPIKDIQPWLNREAMKGYRLVRTYNMVYTFEKTNKKYSYTCQYLGVDTTKEIEEYIKYLEKNSFNYFYVPLNQGNLSSTNVKFTQVKALNSIGKNYNNFAREIIIIENKESVNLKKLSISKEFAINSYRNLAKNYLAAFILLALAFIPIIRHISKNQISYQRMVALVGFIIIELYFALVYFKLKSNISKLSK